MQATSVNLQLKPGGAAAGGHVTIALFSRGPSHSRNAPSPSLTFLARPDLAKNWSLQRYEPRSWWPALVLAWIGRASLPRWRSRLCQCAVRAIQPFRLCRRSPTSVEKLRYFPLAAAPDTDTCFHPSEAKALVPEENGQP